MIGWPRSVSVALALAVCASRGHGQEPGWTADRVTKQPLAFRNDSLALLGYLFKPEGSGPFPAVLWNHGSEWAPGRRAQFDSAGAVFVRAGYVMFAPVRRGHLGSEGQYLPALVRRARETGGSEAANRMVVRELETTQLSDQLAGLRYLKGLPFVDSTRIVVAGCSYGGIQALLGAESDAGYRAALSLSPAALSWSGNPLLRARLVEAARRIAIPVMLLQPARDASLEPSRVLGAEFRRLGRAFAGKVYPATGPEELQGHCFGGFRGVHVWADDALAFFREHVR